MSQKHLLPYNFSLSTDGTTYYRWGIHPRHIIRADKVAFTPRQGSGATSLSDFSEFQSLELTSWHSGAGHIETTDQDGYRISEGIDPRNAGRLAVWPDPESITLTGITAIDSLIAGQNVPFAVYVETLAAGNNVFIGGKGGIGKVTFTSGAGSFAAQSLSSLTDADVCAAMTRDGALMAGMYEDSGDLGEVMLHYDGSSWSRVNNEATWAAATAYSNGDIVRPSTPTGFYYEATSTSNTHATTEPTWPTTAGNTVVDNSVITWTAREYDTWAASTATTVGDFVIPTTPNDYYYKAVKVNTSTGGDVTGASEPTWPTTVGGQVDDEDVTWATLAYDQWATGTATEKGDFVVPTTANGFYYEATTVAAGSSHATTEPTWPTTAGNTVVDNGVTWTTRAEGNAPIFPYVFATHDGYRFYAQGKFEASGTILAGNLLHYWSDGDGSDAEGYTRLLENSRFYTDTGDPGSFSVGPFETWESIKALVPYNGLLYAFRPDGVWSITLQSDGSYVATSLGLVDRAEADHGNFSIALVWNGSLWFNIRHRILRWNGSTVADLSIPSFEDDERPFAPVHRLWSATAMGRYLYVLAETEEDSGALVTYLWCTDGNGVWHRLYQVASDVVQATLFVRGEHTGNTNRPYSDLCAIVDTGGSDSTLYCWPFDYDQNQFPDTVTKGALIYNRFVSASGTLSTSRIDAGLRLVPKAWHSVKVHAALFDVPADIDTIDGVVKVTANWWDTGQTAVQSREIGTIAESDFPGYTAGANIALTYAEVVKEMAVLDSSGDPISSNQLWLDIALDMPTDTGSTKVGSVELLALNLKYTIRPETTWGWQLILPMYDEARGKEGMPMVMRHNTSTNVWTTPTAGEIYEFLESCRDSTVAISYEDNVHGYNTATDPHTRGLSGKVFVSAIRFQPDFERAESNEAPGIQVVISLVEMNNGT